MTEYGAGLFSQHAKLLEDSAISVEVARARGYVTADTKAQLGRCGFGKSQRNVPALVIPVWNTAGDVALYQSRPDEPRVTDAGKTVKYETPAKARMTVDVHPLIRDRMGDPSVPLWITEGVRKADAAISHGLCCVALLGVWNWRGTNGSGGKTALPDWNDIALNGRTVYVCFDSDVMTKPTVAKALGAFKAWLETRKANVRLVYLPDGPDGAKQGLDDYLAGGGSVGELATYTSPPDTPAGELDEPPTASQVFEPRPLADVEATFRRWLHMPDMTPLHVVLGAVAANLLPGDPLWLLIVGPPGSGKTELLAALSKLPQTHQVGTLTEGALLSGTSKRERAAGAKGGLLRQIGTFGYLILKDFTSILSMHRDARAAVLAAFRELYDGAWTRHVGTDGGQTLTWTGKLAVIGAVTGAIDQHHVVIGVMGERFVLYRLPATDEHEQPLRALADYGHETEMRRELAEAVAGLFAHMRPPEGRAILDSSDADRLAALAALAVRCRSAVVRDSYHRDIELVPEPEAPGRLAKCLAQLSAGLDLIGLPDDRKWDTVKAVALDSIPAIRRNVLDHLAGQTRPVSTTAVGDAVSYPTTTTRRTLEDLTAHGICRKIAAANADPEDRDGNADLWELTAWTRAKQATVEGVVPEMSQKTNGEGEDAGDVLQPAQKRSITSPSPLSTTYRERRAGWSPLDPTQPCHVCGTLTHRAWDGTPTCYACHRVTV